MDDHDFPFRDPYGPRILAALFRSIGRIFEMGGKLIYNSRISRLETSVMVATEDDVASTVVRDWEVTVN